MKGRDGKVIHVTFGPGGGRTTGHAKEWKPLLAEARRIGITLDMRDVGKRKTTGATS